MLYLNYQHSNIMEINNIAITVEVSNYETSVCEVLTADDSTKNILIDASGLSPENLSTYMSYVTLFANKLSVRIINSDEQFAVTRRTSLEIIEEDEELDYTTLSELDQAILHAFYNMVLSLG